MKVVVVTRYGPPEVLEFREVEKPVPADNEILIRTRAATVSSGDWRVRSLIIPRGMRFMARLALGFSKPRQPVLGTELAGDVESVGKDVKNFKVGDRVFAFTGAPGMGTHAEYRCVSESSPVAHIPDNLGYDEAAALCFGGTTVLDYFRRGKIKAGEKVLINGASGAVGAAAVQLAKHAGTEVTGVCSTSNVELVRSLGATHVIDYKKEDFTRNGVHYDVIMDTAGTAPYARSKNSLTVNGRLLQVLGGLPDLLLVPWVSMTSRKRIVAGPAAEKADDVRLLGELAARGEYRAVIDRRYSFEQIVEAHRYVDAGHKKGSVVITFGESSQPEEHR